MPVTSPGLPMSGWRRFQPVLLASGTETSGRRMPATSFPSSSTSDTSAGYVSPSPGGSFVVLPSACSGP